MTEPEEVWIEVTQEQVDAAKLHVDAYRAVGWEPDPVVEAMANAEELDHDPRGPGEA
jgi:hypothetical protein